MAVSVGAVIGAEANPMFKRKFGKNKDMEGRGNIRVMASSGCGGLKEEYKILRLSPGATEKEVKKAYRRLALQYHPDICRGDNCGVRFLKINEAYQTLMSSLFEANEPRQEEYNNNNFTDVEEWEEWMGWEGASPTRDYSNHINYYA